MNNKQSTECNISNCQLQPSSLYLSHSPIFIADGYYNFDYWHISTELKMQSLHNQLMEKKFYLKKVMAEQKKLSNRCPVIVVCSF